jgi:hypothetical protein
VQSATLNGQLAPQGSYQASTSSPVPNGDATLFAVFNQPGNWLVTLLVTVSYTNAPPNNSSASATVVVPITVVQLTLSPNPVFVPVGGMAGVTVNAPSRISYSDVTVATDNPGIASVSGSMPTSG